MRNLKKFYAIAVVVAMLVAMMAPAVFAAGTTATAGDYSDAAKALYDLGLYKGISDKDYQPDLDATLDRQTAATMVLRLFGEESKALAMDVKDAKNILAKKFTDASTVADWAVKQVAYAVDNDVIKGFPDGTFQPKGLVTGKQYNTLVLKLLGYTDFTFDQAGAKFAKVAGLEAADQDAFDVAGPIKKNILVGISRKALDAKPEGSDKTLAQQLITDGVLDATKAKTILGITAPTAAPSTSANPSASSTAGAAYNGVEVTATASPALMARKVDDFTFLNLSLKNGNSQDVSFSQFSIAMDRFTGTNTKVKDIKIWEGDTKKSVGTAKWSGTTYTAVINLTTPMLIKANETKNLKITADVGDINSTDLTGDLAATLGEIYKFTVTDLQFAGSPNMPVRGIPLAGPAVQVSTVTAATTLKINDETKTGTTENMAIGGRGIEVGRFKLSAPDDEKVTVSSLKITSAGITGTGRTTASTGEIDSVELWNDTTLLGSAGLDQNIVFSTPLVILAGTNVIVTVKVNTTTDLDSIDSFKASIADASDVIALGDKFGETVKLEQSGSAAPWVSRSQFDANEARISVTSVGGAESNTALLSANDFRLGTVKIKNDNVEDVKISDIKLNLTTTASAFSTTDLSDIRLMAGSSQIAREASLPTASSAAVANETVNSMTTNTSTYTNGTPGVLYNYSIDFSISNEYLIPKNTEVSFDVLADVSSAISSGKKAQLFFYQAGSAIVATPTNPHLSAVGQSSGNQLYADNTDTTGAGLGSVAGNLVTFSGSTGEYVVVSADSDWDSANTAARAIAAGTGRVVADWKIAADDNLNEDADVKYLDLVNTIAPTDVTPQSYYLSNFELYYDGVKVATSSMSSDYHVKFGTDSSSANTLFTVKNNDTAGRKLTVKCDISDDSLPNTALNLVLQHSTTGSGATHYLYAKGVSTSGEIVQSGSGSLGLSMGNKLVKNRYATFVKVTGGSTTAAAGGIAELFRFTVTPETGKSINLSDMAICISDQLGTTTGEAISVWDVTNSLSVPLKTGTNTLNALGSLPDRTIYFNEPDFGYTSVSSPITFAVRLNTWTSPRSYQAAVKFINKHLQIGAPTTDGINGFAALGDAIAGDVITTTN